MALLLHMREDQYFYRPRPKYVARQVSFLTNLTLGQALTLIRGWETAHAKLDNGATVSETLLAVTDLGYIDPRSLEQWAAATRASLVETLPQRPEDFQ